LNSNKLLTEQAADAINAFTITESVAVGTIGAGGAGTAAGVGATSVAAAAIGPVVLVLGGIVAIGGLGYGGFELWRANENDKIRGRDLERYVKQDIESSIWELYFKDDVYVRRERIDYYFRRDHEAIDSYIKYLQESIIEPELLNDEEFKKKISKYKKIIEENIKPEYMLDFHKELRIWCAYHKVGEFTEKNSSWHSDIWYQRENLKKRMFECFKDDLKYEEMNEVEKIFCKEQFAKDSNGKFVKVENGDYTTTSLSFRESEFNVIRDKFYKIFKAIEYLKTEDFRPEEYISLTEEINKAITDRVNPEKRKDFDLLFRKYRYLGQKAEFDRENVLNTRFYNQMYSYALRDWNNSKNGSFAGNIAKKAVKTAAITFAIEFTLIMAGIGIANIATQAIACEAGDQGACIALESIIQAALENEAEVSMAYALF